MSERESKRVREKERSGERERERENERQKDRERERMIEREEESSLSIQQRQHKIKSTTQSFNDNTRPHERSLFENLINNNTR